MVVGVSDVLLIAYNAKLTAILAISRSFVHELVTVLRVTRRQSDFPRPSGNSLEFPGIPRTSPATSQAVLKRCFRGFPSRRCKFYKLQKAHLAACKEGSGEP